MANEERHLQPIKDAFAASGFTTKDVSQGPGQGDLVVRGMLGAGEPRLVEAKLLQHPSPSMTQIMRDIDNKNAKMARQLGRPGYKGATELALSTSATPTQNAAALQKWLKDPRRSSRPSVLTGVDLISKSPGGKQSVHHYPQSVLEKKNPAAVISLGQKAVPSAAKRPPLATPARSANPVAVSQPPPRKGSKPPPAKPPAAMAAPTKSPAVPTKPSAAPARPPAARPASTKPNAAPAKPPAARPAARVVKAPGGAAAAKAPTPSVPRGPTAAPGRQGAPGRGPGGPPGGRR